MPLPVVATYRVQLHAGFDLDAAAAQADYLAALGVSHVYCSPYLQALPGSRHGYDVVDPTRVNDELGGAAAHERLCRRLAGLGLGQVIDVVPNHMAIGAGNRWWWDVLGRGQRSPYARHFDIDWSSPEPTLRGRILLPVLSERYGAALAAGGVRLARVGAHLVVETPGHRWPLALESLAPLLERAAARAGCRRLAELAEQAARLAASDSGWEAVARGLARLLRGDVAAAAAVDEGLAGLNADVDALDALLRRQHYRLAHWRTAHRELDYRRFFDVNLLVGMCAERDEVFDAMHELPLRWLAEGRVDGLRIDHPDGLRDPEAYFVRLRSRAPRAWIVAEKILVPGEALRPWAVDGTTGYDFLQRAGGLFVDPAGAEPLTQLYAEFCGEPIDLGAVRRECKLLLLRDTFATDVERVTARLVEICARHRALRDHTRHDLREALCELVAALPVYRTYVRGEVPCVDAEDTRCLEAAAAAARRARPDVDAHLFELLLALLLQRIDDGEAIALAAGVQQLSGPVMAKGVEDTAFYRFNRLVSLNEVGGDPGSFGVSVDTFHRLNLYVQSRWPHTMLATATHDTKRGEDARARLHLLSEIPAVWRAAVERWSALAAPYRRGDWPDRNAEYLLYQTLVGAWPLDVERAAAYMEKAAREAKQQTSWTDPNREYEEALQAFVRGLLADPELAGDLEAFARPLVELGRVNSLAQTLLRLTAPGVPDLYQGSELWDLNLVDPDNRRPVDYARRRRLLDSLAGTPPEALLASSDEGLPKLWVIRQALHLRRRRPQWFGTGGDYQPLQASGACAAHVVAFARAGHAVTVVPRLIVGLGGDWRDTSLELPAGAWLNLLSGESLDGGCVALTALLGRFPVALLECVS